MKNERYRCPIGNRCQKDFSSKINLKKHIALKHPDKNEFKCDNLNCNAEFKTHKGLHTHKQRKWCLKEPIVCDVCNLSLKSEKMLLLHKNRKHKNFYTCKVCKKIISNYDNYRNHYKICHKKGNKAMLDKCSI